MFVRLSSPSSPYFLWHQQTQLSIEETEARRRIHKYPTLACFVCLYKIYMDDAEVKPKVLNETFNLHKPSAQKLM